MTVDVSFIGYFGPILAFLIVFVVVYAILFKIKILGDHWASNLFVALVVAAIFVAAAGARDFTLTVIPWFAVVVISLVFLMVIIGFVGKEAAFMNKTVGVIFVIVLGLVFLISAFVVFSESITPYLPGPSFGGGDNMGATAFFDWLYSPRVGGAILLIVIAAIVSAVLVKAK